MEVLILYGDISDLLKTCQSFALDVLWVGHISPSQYSRLFSSAFYLASILLS